MINSRRFDDVIKINTQYDMSEKKYLYEHGVCCTDVHEGYAHENCNQIVKFNFKNEKQMGSLMEILMKKYAHHVDEFLFKERKRTKCYHSSME